MGVDCYRDVDDIAETVSQARKRGCPFSLLIGAGCSVKAGIPTADGFVRAIKDEYPRKYAHAAEKTYACCMGELLVSERNHLVREYLKKAKINWAHIGIAALMQHGYVSRVLTTNFDSLIVQACALLGVFPAVYDCAAAEITKPRDIPDKAVFHLHGQGTGFVLLHTREEMAEQSKRLGRLFQDAGSGHGWIVVGYSGKSDPVFDLLAEAPKFDAGLFWVGYQEDDLGEHVRNRLLTKPGARYTNGKDCDADWFFINLCLKLKIFPPDLVGRPFTNINRLLERLAPFPLAGELDRDLTIGPKEWIADAITRYEPATSGEAEKTAETGLEAPYLTPSPNPSSVLLAEAEQFLMKGEYQGVIGLLQDRIVHPASDLAAVLASAYFAQGIEFGKQAQQNEGAEADRLFALAGEKFEAALRVKSDKPEALNNWGYALSEQARLKEGKESDRLFALAGEKFEAALRIKPDKHTVLDNWGYALSTQAERKEGEDADRLFALAGEKYEEELRIKPDAHTGFYNWGNLFLAWANSPLKNTS
jgi:hypothetical protein